MYQSDQTNNIIAHIRAEYGAEPEFLWPERSPTYCIFRHSNNKRWFALVGDVSRKSLGLDSSEKVEIINLKFDAGQALEFAENAEHIYPAYHMNKRNWITVVLNNSLPDEAIFELIKKSYLLTG